MTDEMRGAFRQWWKGEEANAVAEDGDQEGLARAAWQAGVAAALAASRAARVAAVAAERERCAKVAGFWAEVWREDGDDAAAMGAEQIASGIREGQ